MKTIVMKSLLEDEKIEIFSPNNEPKEVEDLIYSVLYKKYSVPEEPRNYWNGANEQGVVIVLRAKNDKILGTARLVFDSDDLSEGEIKKFVVNPSVQGKGIGKRLINYIEDYARKKGIKKIVLGAREPAYKFYEKMGYKYISEEYESKLTHIPHRDMEKKL